MELYAFRYMSSYLDGLPEPLDEDVVHPAAPAVHADPYAGIRENARECLRGALAALVGVEYVRRSVPCYRLFQGVDAERGVERVG